MKTNTTLKIATIPFIALMLMALASDASGKQHTQNLNGREVVVHTNPIPVILHRMVPPQHGRHVTQKEISKGMVPQSRPATSVRRRP